MKSRKSFAAPAPIEVSTDPAQAPSDDTASLVIDLPENPSCARTINLATWLGKGIDAWARACAGQLRVFLTSKVVVTSTVLAYWVSGLRYFFEFLVATSGPAEPTQLEPRHIRLYIGWLAERGLAYRTQRGIYNHTKSVLTALIRRQIVAGQPDLFPNNPFPGAGLRPSAALPLSPGERLRLAHALRDDLVAIHKGRFEGPDSAALVVHLLAVAIRTGVNPTPLLEASRDCLHPHPFLPNMMQLVLFKRRGNATTIAQLRYSKQSDLLVSVPMDGAALIRKVLELTEPLRAEARPAHRGRVWLYRSVRSSVAAGQVTALAMNTLARSITNFIERHDLRSDDGAPLRLNLSRLRKTMELRLFDLSGGDLLATAAMLGHNPRVADIHYLACTPQIRANAAFVGESLPDIYRAEGGGKKAILTLPDPSPTGRCKDPYLGDKAPKNGKPCDDFFSCFACRSYAIVGSPEDLHRLFSFYCFLEREMHHARTEDWRTEFRHTMNLIERFTADRFDPELVAAARERARIAPLKFWSSYTLGEETAYV